MTRRYITAVLACLLQCPVTAAAGMRRIATVNARFPPAVLPR
jgi:hypothetical protein